MGSWRCGLARRRCGSFSRTGKRGNANRTSALDRMAPPGKIFANGAPGRLSVAAHVICSNLVRDALKAEIVHQPLEQCGAVMPVHTSLVAKLTKQVERACEAADLMNQANGIIYRNGIEVDWSCF